MQKNTSPNSARNTNYYAAPLAHISFEPGGISPERSHWKFHRCRCSLPDLDSKEHQEIKESSGQTWSNSQITSKISRKLEWPKYSPKIPKNAMQFFTTNNECNPWHLHHSLCSGTHSETRCRSRTLVIRQEIQITNRTKETKYYNYQKTQRWSWFRSSSQNPSNKKLWTESCWRNRRCKFVNMLLDNSFFLLDRWKIFHLYI